LISKFTCAVIAAISVAASLRAVGCALQTLVNIFTSDGVIPQHVPCWTAASVVPFSVIADVGAAVVHRG
jgi:hypothetical protein